MPYTSIDQLLNEQTITTLRMVTHGTCALVDPEEFSQQPTLITTERALAPNHVKLLSSILLDVDSWFFVVKRCLPKNTATLTLISEYDTVCVLIGMTCYNWSLRTAAETTGGFFDPVKDTIRTILKTTFPEYASPDNRVMWRSGAIRELKRIQTMHKHT